MSYNLNFKKILFLNFPIFLISLIPFFLITGPFLSDLALSLVVIIFIIIVVKEKKFSLFKNKFFYIFCFFYIYILANSLLQNQNIDSIKISIFYFRFGVFSISLVYFLNKKPILLNYIFYCLLICFLILIFDGLYQYNFDENLIGYKLAYPGPRVSSFFDDELILGSYLSRLLPIFFGLALYFFNKKQLLYFIPILLLVVTLIFLSGERTAAFLMFFSLILISLLIVDKKLYIRLILLTCIMLSSLIVVFSDTARNRIVNDTINQMFNSKWDNKRIFILTRQHDEHYTSAYRMFLDNKLFGVGVKNFRNFCDKEKYNISEWTCSPHPHNTYIQLLSETGIIGFLIVLSLFIYLSYLLVIHFIKIKKNRKNFNDLDLCLLIAIYLTLWPFVPSGNFFNNWLSIIYYFPIGILIWSLSLKSQDLKQPNHGASNIS